jgi:hypothetical protein
MLDPLSVYRAAELIDAAADRVCIVLVILAGAHFVATIILAEALRRSRPRCQQPPPRSRPSSPP